MYAASAVLEPADDDGWKEWGRGAATACGNRGHFGAIVETLVAAAEASIRIMQWWRPSLRQQAGRAARLSKAKRGAASIQPKSTTSEMAEARRISELDDNSNYAES